MADINVAPKRSSNIWLWVVLAVVAVGLIMWMVAGGNDSTPATRHIVAPALLAELATPATVAPLT